MRRLRLLVVLKSILKQTKQIGAPGKAKDEPLPGVPFKARYQGMNVEATGAGGSSSPTPSPPHPVREAAGGTGWR
jgi:hypothetical protein